MDQTTHLVMACSALALLTFGVGIHMYRARIREMKTDRIHPQSVALSAEKGDRLKDTRAADNFSHLFELPVLFYVLCVLAIASQQIPGWLPIAAWIFVVSRFIHSFIQCTYNKVMHRFVIFVAGFFLLALMWIGFLISILVS